MLIGNRRRQQMQRTTSIKRFTVEADDHHDVAMAVVDDGDHTYDERFLSMFSPENQQSQRKEDVKSPSSTSSFLGKCGFCKLRLAPGRDIYMYKGDAAFCSVECREQQIDHDQGKTQNGVVLSPSN
ncbi:unnamed protein product [Cochlearia groenlandica]